MSQDVQGTVIERILRRVPLVGYGIRLFETEQDKELALFGANVLASVILLVGVFGFPVFICVMWAAVAVVAGLIFSATRV